MIQADINTLNDHALPSDGLAMRPLSIDISLTGRCNLRCRYCFYSDEMVARSELPTARWLELFRELGDLAVQRVSLSGGEVFTRLDIFELIDSVIENKMRYSLLTNGTLITKDTIAAFAEGKRRLRLDSIQVSIDGSCARVHNKSRPPDSFDAALKGLRLLLEADFPVTVRVTINHHNMNDLGNIAALLLDDLGLQSFSTNEAEQMCTTRCYGQDIELTMQERRQAYLVLSGLNRLYDNRIKASAGPLALGEDMTDIEERCRRGETGIEGRGTLSSCGGVFTKMAILHDGTMVPCTLLPTFAMGVISTTPLQEAWLHHPSITVVRERSRILLESLPGCSDCEYTGFCAGGCPASVMAQFGTLNAADPKFCYRLHQRQGERA